MYWISNKNGQYSIEGGSFDGMKRWMIAEKATLQSPSGLFYDYSYKKYVRTYPQKSEYHQSTTMYFDNYIWHTCLLVTNINYFGKILSEFCRLFFIDKGELKSILPDGSSLLALNSVGSDSKVVVYKVSFTDALLQHCGSSH